MSKLLDMYEPNGADLLSTFVEGLKANVQALKATYPVGRMYISTSNISPAEFIGGTTWKAVGSGRVLVTAGFNEFMYSGDTRIELDGRDAGMEGGSPRHTHLTPMGFDGSQLYGLMGNDLEGNSGVPIYNSAKKDHQHGVYSSVSNFDDNSVRVAYTRENTSYPPYYTVYIWERVA